MKKAVALVLALIMLVALVACGGGGTSTPGTSGTPATPGGDINVGQAGEIGKDAEIDATKTYKKEIMFVHPSPLRGDDPQIASGTDTSIQNNLIYNQLIYYNFLEAKAEPELAVSWVEESSSSYLFNLRKGVKFSNGEEFTSDDILFSFVERPVLVTATQGTNVFNNIEKIECIDEYTVRIILKKADTDFLLKMYLPAYCIFNREACTADPEKGHRIGTGGWILTSYDGNVESTFERFDDSWVWEEKGVSPTEKLIYRVMPEQSARAIAVQNGEACASSYINQMAELKEMQRYDSIETAAYNAENVELLLFNMYDSIFSDDKNLRYAVAYAINIPDHMLLMQDGLGERAYTLWSKAQFAYYDDFGDAKLEHNLEKAKEYLAKSKHPNGVEITITTVAYREPMATLMQEQLQKLPGVTVKVETVDTVGLAALVKEKDTELVLYGCSQQPVGSRHRFLSTTGSSNRAYYYNDELLAQYDAAMAEPDEAKRIKMYQDIQIFLNDEKPYIPLFYSVTGAAWHKGVSGISWEPNYYTDFTYVVWEE